jgi:CPA2 family monovalent cation:H+ antiporter-2/glutathione-regulated potassium-efflux system ancillary protein KefC
VLGYLIAGVVIGPVLGLVGEEMRTLQHYAEFGVVMMLFLVGLELEPRMLWGMRDRLLGLGGLQVGSTIAAVATIALLFGLPWPSALAVGFMLSLSSTAIVLQTFDEKGLASTPGGRAAFSVLLFQDIAVIPMLALVPLLALPALVAAGVDATQGEVAAHDGFGWVAGLEAWAHGLVVLGSIVGVVLGGHFLSRPLFRMVAATGLREAFTAVALMLVIGVALLMMAIGLSPALGTFLAGVVLANSEFRHELETDIVPFKGLLLGLFFITVGAGIQFELLTDQPTLVLGLTLGIMALKLGLLFGLALLFGVRRSDGWLFALSLAQAGEFGFVLLNYSVINGAIAPAHAPILSLVVALSMFLTPLLFMLFDRAVIPRYVGRDEARDSDEIDEQAPVIIAGIGRFGQIVNRLLTANGVKTVVLDRQVGQIDNMRRIRMKSYFGDATRPDLLEAAGLAQASLFVVAIDEEGDAVALVRELKRRHPRLGVLARGFDRGHVYRLREAGADYVVSETYHSALELGTRALRSLGVHPFKAEQLRGAFSEAEERGRDQLYRAWLKRPEGERMGDDYLQLFIELDAVLREAMQRDRDDGHTRSERGWTPPPKPLVSSRKTN